MFPYVKKKTICPITIKEHFLRRNKVLIKRKAGVYGDIIMQRMMFEDFHKVMPEINLTYACPRTYLEFAKDHPYAETVAIEEINERTYGASYDITTVCRVHESKMGGKNTIHRSDIWANHCGVKLSNHNCFMECKEKEFYIEKLYEINTKKLPMVLVAAKSTKCMFGQSKSLTDTQIYEVCKKLCDKGFFVYTIHNEPLEIFTSINIPQFIKIEPESWKGLVAAADYVISIDTGTFHLAGALKKPLVGVFSFTDGKVYGRHYDFELVQKHRDNGDWECGPCYLCIVCPKSKEMQKPCITELKSDQIIQGFENLIRKYPIAGLMSSTNLELIKEEII